MELNNEPHLNTSHLVRKFKISGCSNEVTERLFAKIYKKMSEWSSITGMAGDEGEDIIHDALLKLLDKLATFEWQGKGQFWSYCRRTLYSEAIDCVRRMRAEQAKRTHLAEHLIAAPPDNTIEQEAQNLIKSAQLQEAEERVRRQCTSASQQRNFAIYRQHYYDKLAYVAIAKTFDIPEATAKAGAHRIKEEVKAVFEELRQEQTQ
jgi:RNA polymerase sigma factor (sigma-70 family)